MSPKEAEAAQAKRLAKNKLKKTKSKYHSILSLRSKKNQVSWSEVWFAQTKIRYQNTNTDNDI